MYILSLAKYFDLVPNFCKEKNEYLCGSIIEDYNIVCFVFCRPSCEIIVIPAQKRLEIEQDPAIIIKYADFTSSPD